ncbi:hypothetical protein [Actinophytocola sp.]|jgi:hypothetical protein|uniref:hypothetical protein n=1 Tax=Actinophytocola sp. TaxID=1872138 RepID=UPI002EDB5796
MSLVGRQLVGTWVVGSATTGTLAVLFTLDRGGLPVSPLDTLPVLSLLGVLGMLAALFAALGLLAWGTGEVSWLPDEVRGRVLWTVLVGVAGLAGWGYAAAATFAGGFSLPVQLVLGYVAGGLPFTLIAAMLLRPVRVDAVAVGVAVVLLLAGAVIMDGHPIQVCAGLLWALFGPTVTGL